jgi:hypothetical protein
MTFFGNVTTGGGGTEGQSLFGPRMKYRVINPNSSWTTFGNWSWLSAYPTPENHGGTIDDLPTRLKNRYNKWKKDNPAEWKKAQKGSDGVFVYHDKKYYWDSTATSGDTTPQA